MDHAQNREALNEHLETGTILNLGTRPADSAYSAFEKRTWADDQWIHSADIREILRRPHGGDQAYPQGVRIQGARIVGRLDLDFISTNVRLELVSCYLPEGVSAVGFQGPLLDMSASLIEHTTDSPLVSTIDLSRARIDEVRFMNADIRSSGACALDATGAHVTNDFDLSQSSFESSSLAPTVDLQRSRISGQLRMPSARVANTRGPALNASGATLANNVLLNHGFEAIGKGPAGTIRLLRSNIFGQLSMHGAVVTNDSGPALTLDAIKVDGGVFLADGFCAEGKGPLGTVRLLHAKIENQLTLNGAVLRNESGPALVAEGLSVSGTLFFGGGFEASGDSDRAAILMQDISLAGLLHLRDSTVRNAAGPAIICIRSTIGSDAILSTDFVAQGRSKTAAVRLSGTRVEGALSMRGAQIYNSLGPALSTAGLQVGGDLLLDGDFCATRPSPGIAVNIDQTRIVGSILVSNPSIARAVAGLSWSVDGLTYSSYPGPGFASWLKLLKKGTPEYRPQPYQHLAGVGRASGHESDAKKTLITQLNDRTARGHLSRPARAWSRFTRFSLGYGYQPWRALIGVAAVALAAILLLLCNPDATYQTAPGHPCNPVQQIKVAIDLVIPLIRTNVRTPCVLLDTGPGEQVSATGIVLTSLGWALTALFAAGFTRAVRQV